MTNASARTRGGRLRLAAPWLLLAAVPVVVTVLAAADRQWKTALHAGFLPADAQLVVQAADFPVFLDALQRTRAGEAVLSGLPELTQELALSTRLETGIRPTLLRWRVWFGPRLLAAARGGTWGLCVKPGLLARGAHALNRVFGAGRYGGGIWRYGRFHYAWRDGYLIVSPDCGYVSTALAAPAAASEDLAGDQVSLAWTGTPAGRLEVRASAGLPVSGALECRVTERRAPLVLADAWPDAPLVSLTASRVEDAAALGALLRPIGARLVGELRACGLAQVPQCVSYACGAWFDHGVAPDWQQAVEECSVALTDVAFGGGIVPMPGLALVLRSSRAESAPHPLQPLVDGDAFPFEWNGVPGLVFPVLGEYWTLCLASGENAWYAAAQEPAMSRIANRLDTSSMVHADIALRVDWRRWSGVAEEFLRRAAQFELVPEVDARDAEQLLLPYARVLAQFGTLRLDGRMERDILRIEGCLAQTEAPGRP